MLFVFLVPTEPPADFQAQTISSTEVRCTWDPPPTQSWNGDLLGYKIYYWALDGSHGNQVKTVAATENEAILTDLKMYTEYGLVMLAFNAAGDGPNTTVPIATTTNQGVPDQPGVLDFTMISLTELNVTWTPPSLPNGIITSYEVSYYQDMLVDGKDYGLSRHCISTGYSHMNFIPSYQ